VPELPDIQNTTTGFIKKHIYKVGINNYKLPIGIWEPNKKITFNTIAKVSTYASLRNDKKGTNMSRLSHYITECAKDHMCSDALLHMLKGLKQKMEADDCYVKLRYDYLTKVISPESKIESWFNIPVVIEGEINQFDEIKKYITVNINYTSLCPCSKEMSIENAHNQRSNCRIKIEQNLNYPDILFEDLKSIVDKHCSCPIYNTLKRPDEKYVTDKMYNNPKFCEDTARGVAQELDKMIEIKHILDYVIVAENFESIHQSNAVAVITAGKKLK